MLMRITSPKNNQTGMGLIEVLVALLVLAVGVMGYAAMQTRAMQGSQDALSRTKALALSQDIAERMRNNSVSEQSLLAYQTKFQEGSLSAISCQNGCSVQDQANNDVLYIKNEAEKDGMQINMESCPGNATNLQRSCLIVSWGDTSPSFSTGNICIDTEGNYQQESQCIVMEVY